MNQKHSEMDAKLEEIRHLLSHLHGEVTALEQSYSQVLLVLERVEGVANRDELTGLLRRKAFFSAWEALLEECRQLGEECGILIVDIDHFKRINDTHGHATGDEVIRRVAGLLKQYESPRCCVGRFGGEEFVLGIRGSEAEMLGMAEMIRRGAENLRGEEAEWKCTLSVGAASAVKEGYSRSRLFKAADEALYRAKNGGRNQVRYAA